MVPPPPLNPDCLGGRINPLQSPFLFLPSSHACLASKLVSDVKPTGLSQSLSYTHTKTSLSIWDAPTRFPFQTTLLPTGLNVFFRFGPTHPTTLQSVRTLSFSANLSATKPRIPPPTPPSIRQDGQPILVRSLRHCSLIKSPGPDRDYKVVLKDPSVISTHPSPTDSIPASPCLASPLFALSQARYPARASGHWIPPRSSKLHNSEHHHSSTSPSLLSPPRSQLLNPSIRPACGA